MGRNFQGQVLDGQITQPLGTAKLQEMAKATVPGMMALAIRVATTPVIPGAITDRTGTICFSEVLDQILVYKMYWKLGYSKWFGYLLLLLSMCVFFFLNCIGLTHGIMHLNSSRAGVPVLEMEVKAGVMVEMVPDQGATTTGGSPKKVPAPLAGTVTATGPVQGVGVSQADPTPTPAATPG